jgi:acid phosphatase
MPGVSHPRDAVIESVVRRRAASVLACVVFACAALSACSRESVAPRPGTTTVAPHGGRTAEPRQTRPAPANGSTSDRRRIVALGDFGTGESAESQVASAIERWSDDHGIDALVSTGDNVYDSGNPAQFAGAWLRPFGWVRARGVPVVAALGNHDIETDGGAPVMRLLGMPGPWYTRRVGPVELLVLDANDPTNPAQLRFLHDALARSTAPWRVAVFHQPIYSCSHHGSTPAVDAAWLPALEHGGVSLVLNGHDHTYERFGPIGGTTYVVTGGGGAPLYTETACPPGTPAPAVHVTTYGFVTLTATTRTLRLVAYDANLRRIDAVRIQGDRAR